MCTLSTEYERTASESNQYFIFAKKIPSVKEKKAEKHNMQTTDIYMKSSARKMLAKRVLTEQAAHSYQQVEGSR